MSLSEQVQALPLWLTISGAAFFFLFFGGSPILVGFFMERHRTAPARAFEHQVMDDKRQAETFEREHPKTLALETAPVQVIRDDRPTLVLPPPIPLRELPIAGSSHYQTSPTAIEVWRDESGTLEMLEFTRVFGPAPERNDQEPCGICSGRGCPDCQEDAPPRWAQEITTEWDLGAILDAEIVDTETEAERLFRKDPLGCWVHPPEEMPDYLPMADKAFWALVNRNQLSGEGADVDITYRPLFTDYELEEVYA